VTILVFSIVAVGHRIYSVTQKSQAQLQALEDDAKKKLPQKIDAVTTLVDVKYEPKISSYWYTISESPEQIDINQLKANIQHSACANSGLRHTIRDEGFSYVYHYKTSSGVALLDFAVSSCP
jgi:hypothetical protein